MKPVRLDLEMWSDSAFAEFVIVTLNGVPETFVGWEFKSLACETVNDAEALFDIDVTPDEDGKLNLFVLPEKITLAFTEGSTLDKRKLPWVLKAKPNTEYPVRLAYGFITVHRGLPPWV